MTRTVKFLNKVDQEQALEEMLAEQLLFFPEQTESRLRLRNYLQNQCNQPDFNYLSTDYDHGVIIAAIPNLGSKQLGVYAAKSFEKGDIVGEIKGIDLFGIQPNSRMEQVVKEYQGDSTYVWQLNLDDKDEYAVVIDMLKSGSSTRWVNHAAKPNLEVKVICNQQKDKFGTVVFDYHAYYIATRKIAFADELTISYGDEYFTKDRPQILRQPQTLIEVLRSLAKTLGQEFTISDVSTREGIKSFFDLLITLRAAMKKESKKQMYLDKNLDPKIYDLNKFEDVARFQKNQKMELQRNSPYHLFIAPTVRNGVTRYSLFSGQEIPAKKTLCRLVGQGMDDVPEKDTAIGLWAVQRGLDTNYLVQSGAGGYLYTKDKASEAYCIEGANRRKEMNVRFDFATDSYVTTRQIQPGEEILAYYSDYDYSASPTNLTQVVADFNESQYYYHADWSEHGMAMEYVIPKTPGYNLDEMDEPVFSPPFKEEQTNEWLVTSDFEQDTGERILTPGHNSDTSEQEFSQRLEKELSEESECSHEKMKSTWSPTFQFSENLTTKKRKRSELTKDEEGISPMTI
ncbi:SET domain [Legionella steigerwaltii]|uniref:SET domain n=1 Tax=Legionella steigerwaltii TaxID=460 RepID=A0A378LBZ6_9GAMM|nr:SET domain-containing protein [Legionella steigerwaltii]KTD79569.1 SET domain protein [Legionella steigerwaltii]STY24545.1 SET domain [Legionella steigerwaltii]